MKQNTALVAIIKRQGKVLLTRHESTLRIPSVGYVFDHQPAEQLKQFLADEFAISSSTIQLYDALSYNSILCLVYMVGIQVDRLESRDHRYVWKKLSEIHQEDTDDITAVVLGIVASEDSFKEVATSNVDNDTTKAIIYSDGGSRGNPGPSAAAYVILNTTDQVIDQGSVYLGLTTNNQAEYQAILIALEAAKQLGIKTVDFRSDSMLVVNQLNGLYAIKNRELWPTYERIKEILPDFENVKFTHVKREFNQLADGLVNKTLNEHAAQRV